jgi:uncharacterized protein YehS (DUF1456 family)
MTQKEKLDIILKRLYSFKFDGKYYDIKEILVNNSCDVNREEVFALAKRLDKEGLIKMLVSKDNIMGLITSYGAEYSETDSYTYEGRAVITNNYEIKIENSPGSNIVNKSEKVTINTQENNITDILTKILEIIDKEVSVEEDKKREIHECAKEIQNNLIAGQVPILIS